MLVPLRALEKMIQIFSLDKELNSAKKEAGFFYFLEKLDFTINLLIGSVVCHPGWHDTCPWTTEIWLHTTVIGRTSATKKCQVIIFCTGTYSDGIWIAS